MYVIKRHSAALLRAETARARAGRGPAHSGHNPRLDPPNAQIMAVALATFPTSAMLSILVMPAPVVFAIPTHAIRDLKMGPPVSNACVYTDPLQSRIRCNITSFQRIIRCIVHTATRIHPHSSIRTHPHSPAFTLVACCRGIDRGPTTCMALLPQLTASDEGRELCAPSDLSVL